MQVSASGRALIAVREGRRLLAYRDSVGVWTIGVGHTGRMAGPPVHEGMRITDAECDACLAADLAPVEAAINKIGVPLSQNQFDALASLAFNIGVYGFAASTVVKRLRILDMAGAADAILLWDKPAVLKARREAERKQFLTPDAPPNPRIWPHPDKPATPAAVAPASPPAAQKASTMNPISMFTMAVSLARDVAPYVPHLVSDVPLFVGDCEKIIADATKLDATATIADIGKLVNDVKTELPTILMVAKASKGLALA